MTTDGNIHAQIAALVSEEHSLTGQADAAERRQLIEEQLDQCWDLLRQRQARREFGEDPGEARPRSTEQVEGYLQ